MSRLAVVAAAMAIAACAASPPPTAPVTKASPPPAAAPVMRNPGFEEPTPADRPCPVGWECSAHAAVESFRFSVSREGASGAASMCIERVGGEPWALATQGFHTTAMRGRTLRLSMAVHAHGLTGGGGAGPWIQSQGGRAHAQKLVQATKGWERVVVELAIPAESNLIVVGATLDGSGRACFDDVRLEVL
jgi:hypothetical protein